ncbi:unnamed protein product [Amaranthus hypochondriacus]
MSSSGSPCAGCKFLRRKCTQDCLYAPYFPPDQPKKFSTVHKVYGASNVAKLLNELNPSQREDAANSLAYEAEMRLSDPINGCVAVVYALQQQLQSIQSNVKLARKQLSSYIGTAGVKSFLNQYSYAYLATATAASSSSSVNQQINMGLGQRQCLSPVPMRVIPSGVVASPGAVSSHVGIGQSSVIRGPQNQQQQQAIEAHQLAAIAARKEQDVMMRNLQHQQLTRLGGSSASGGYSGRMIINHSIGGAGGGSAGGDYNQVGFSLANAQPSLALGAFGIDHMAQQHQHQQQHEQQVDESLRQFLLREQLATTQPHQGHVDQLGQGNQQLLQHHRHQQQQQHDLQHQQQEKIM